MERVWEQTGKQPKTLAEAPELPDECRYLWSWYLELHGGESGVTYTEIGHWSALMGVRVQAWEVEAIKTVDRLYWKAQACG